jgi:hypothetical protein
MYFGHSHFFWIFSYFSLLMPFKKIQIQRICFLLQHIQIVILVKSNLTHVKSVNLVRFYEFTKFII